MQYGFTTQSQSQTRNTDVISTVTSNVNILLCFLSCLPRQFSDTEPVLQHFVNSFFPCFNEVLDGCLLYYRVLQLKSVLEDNVQGVDDTCTSKV